MSLNWFQTPIVEAGKVWLISVRAILAFCILCFFGAQNVFASESAPLKDCAECPLVVLLPEGSFEMGANRSEIEWILRKGGTRDSIQREVPAHHVTVKPFLLARTEVTRSQFEAFAIATGFKSPEDCDWRKPALKQTPSDPVVCVSWNAANAYVAWLSKVTGRRYRLPTEEEWEYAARAGLSVSTYWRYDESQACGYANVFDLASIGDIHPPNGRNFPCSDGYEFTAPAGSFKPNAFALYDMLGNALEWTSGCYGPYTGEVRHPLGADGAAACVKRVARGGSWLTDRLFQRVSFRYYAAPTFTNSEFGFRVARDR